jgi:hypothetical protein
MVGAAIPSPIALSSALLPGARVGELGVDDGLQRARYAQAAEPLRVVHPGQARVEPGVEEVLLAHLGRVVFGQEGAGPVADRVRGCFCSG